MPEMSALEPSTSRVPDLDHRDLDQRVIELAARYLPLAVGILREAIRIPADEVDRSIDDGGDPRAGLSNHEGGRLRFLRDTIIDVEAVRHADDVWFDDYGNLVWVARDPFDGVAPEHLRVIYFDGHTDTVQALRAQWLDKLGGAIDPYHGLVDGTALDPVVLRGQLGYVPPDDEWEHLVFGRGSADQLAGVVAQIIATKILLELVDEGALRGCIVRAYATAAEEDNDGGGPRHVVAEVLPGSGEELIPDVVVLTEGTGDAIKGALGIYRGQRGRMQIEVTVVGRSCHGSMPFEGLNPLEHGGAIIAEAARRHAAGEGFAEHPFLGRGTRTASWAVLDSPSDCAVPDRFMFRFDRRLTVGETPEQALADIESLEAVAAARCRWADSHGRGAALHATDLARVPGRQRADLPRVDHSGRPPGHPRGRRCLPPCGHTADHRARRRCHRRSAAQGATGRQVDLLDRRRGLPDRGRRRNDRRRPGQALGGVRSRQAPADVRHRRRNRAEHPSHRRVRRRPRTAARDRSARSLPSFVRGADPPTCRPELTRAPRGRPRGQRPPPKR